MADNKDKREDTEEEGPDIVELDGEQFEVIDVLAHEGINYYALVPYTEDENIEGEAEFVILKEQQEGDDFYLATVDDDKLYDELGELFIKHFDEIFGEDAEEE